MCGIAGFSGRFDPALLGEMGTAIAHRGPDDYGTHHGAEHGVGLVHRRLSILDLSACGHQPMWDAERRACIVFNGEIFNFRELRAELERDGARFRSTSDTEVLLELYLRRGTGMLTVLNGMFAFAIYDTRSGRTFVARDGLGVKPLYHAQVDKGFLFASELKALLREPTLGRELDADAVGAHLRYLWSPGPRTALRSVRKLKPGHALLVFEGRVEREWEFYDLPFLAPPTEMSEAEAIARTRDAVDEAVRRQMVSDVPVGAFLSGGLDSSAVVAAARAHADGPLQCFTIGFTEGTTGAEGYADDLPYARRVAKHLGVPLTEVNVGPEMALDLERMIFHLDEPQADLAPLNAMYIAKAAREAGVTVLLSGAGGDDVFSGYRRHFALGAERAWGWLPSPARRALRGATAALPQRRPILRRATKAFSHAHRSADERIAGAFWWLDPERASALLAPDFRAAGDGMASDELLSTLRGMPRATPPLNRMLYLDTRYFLVDHNLNYTDKTSMAHGVEVRVPLLDPDLVRHAGALPTRFKQRGRWGKWALRKAMEGVLPQDVIYRPKAGFGVPLRQWLHGPLAPLLADVLSPGVLRARGIFDPKAVADLVRDDREGRTDGAYPILAVACMEIWCRQFVDR